MLYEIICSGFGGQGILFMGDLLAEAGLEQGYNVTFLPTYGVAMRGGTANCIVKVSDDDIGTPIMEGLDAALIMNEPSMVKFQGDVREGGLLVANSSLIDATTYTRGDAVRVVWVPATEIAREQIGNERSANMVALGAFLASDPTIKPESVETILRNISGASKQALIEKNIAAIHAGMDAVGVTA